MGTKVQPLVVNELQRIGSSLTDGTVLFGKILKK